MQNTCYRISWRKRYRTRIHLNQVFKEISLEELRGSVKVIPKAPDFQFQIPRYAGDFYIPRVSSDTIDYQTSTQLH